MNRIKATDRDKIAVCAVNPTEEVGRRTATESKHMTISVRFKQSREN